MVIDSGVWGTLREVPAHKQVSIDIPSDYQGKHWQDDKGHGSMCATIAAGTTSNGGKFNGVAPEAKVLSARTTFWSDDIHKIYDNLIDLKRKGDLKGPLVITNSYGAYVCGPQHGDSKDHPYSELVRMAVEEEDIPVVFAAGNNHYTEVCNYDPSSCSPTSIWGANSLDSVISAGTVNENNTNRDKSTPHANSSRGPGQFAKDYPKPDCVAPTYGEVVWGDKYVDMPWWGTSGACPQVAGLAALLLSINPALKPGEIANIIRSTARPLDAPQNCVGHGLIDCGAAVSQL